MVRGILAHFLAHSPIRITFSFLLVKLGQQQMARALPRIR